MLKQTLQKITNLIKQPNNQLPQLFCKFYSLLQHLAQSIPQKQIQLDIITFYSDCYHFYQKYSTQEAYQMIHLNVVNIMDSDGEECWIQFKELRNRMGKWFEHYKYKDSIGRAVFKEVMGQEWAKKLKRYAQQTQKIKKEYLSSKNIGDSFSRYQICQIFWLNSFKKQVIVYIEDFMQKIYPFLREYFSLFYFINEESLHIIRSIVDPYKKHFITLANCEDLFLNLRQPSFLKLLYDEKTQTLEKISSQEQKYLQLVLKIMCEGKQLKERFIQIYSNRVVDENGEEQKTKYPDVTRVGSSQDSDLILGNKKISRKQFLFIYDSKMYKPKLLKSQPTNYSLVCLSQTNPTNISYPEEYQASVGTMFLCEKVKIEILCITADTSKDETINLELQEDDDETLTVLPSKLQMSDIINAPKIIELMVLSGIYKGRDLKISSKSYDRLKNGSKASFQKETSISMSQCDQDEDFQNFQKMLKQCFAYDGLFYFKKGVKIVARSAKEVLEKRISKKIRLLKGMKIWLDEHEFEVL